VSKEDVRDMGQDELLREITTRLGLLVVDRGTIVEIQQRLVERGARLIVVSAASREVYCDVGDDREDFGTCTSDTFEDAFLRATLAYLRMAQGDGPEA
jgi:hypothetical protein